MKCLLHIGTEKTGTTSIQRFFALNRDAIVEQGYCYPVSAGMQEHFKLVAYAARDDKRNDLHANLQIRVLSDLTSFRKKMVEELDSELDQAKFNNVHTVLFSSEHCQSRLDTIDEIASLKSLLRHRFDEVHVIVYFRRQDRMAASYYSTAVKYGATHLHIFPEFSGDHLPYYYDFGKLAENWLSVFDQNTIDARIFHAESLLGGDVVRDFCNLCAIDTDKLLMPERENEALHEDALEFLRLFNSYCPDLCAGERNPLRQNVMHILEAKFIGKGLRPSATQAEHFVKRFEASNRRLGELLFSGVNPFDNSYAEYSEKETRANLTTEKCAEIAAELWQVKAAEVKYLKERINRIEAQSCIDNSCVS